MVQFQFYPYPLKKAWRYLSVHFNSDRETLETTTDGPIVITTNVICLGPLQWRWLS